MKKLLIAAAAMSVVAGAQAQSSVTMTGTIDAGYASFSAQATGANKATQKGLAYSTDNTSRFQIAANEDLGGGVKAGVVIESGLAGGAPIRNNFGYNQIVSGTAASINPTTTTTVLAAGAGQDLTATTLGNRILIAQISVGGHNVQFGQNTLFVRDVAVPFQADGSNMVGNLVGNDSSLTGRAVQAKYTYTTGGVKLGASMSSNIKEENGATDVKSATGHGLYAGYTAGPLSLAAGYNEFKTNVAAVSATGLYLGQASSVAVSSTNLGVAAVTAKDTKVKMSSLGASYDLGVAKVFAEYGKVDADDVLSATSTGDSQRKFTSVGARVPFGKAWAFAQYSFGSNQYAGGYDGDAKGYSYGVKYDLSKRTYGYVAAGETKTDLSASTQTKATSYGAGLVHSF